MTTTDTLENFIKQINFTKSEECLEEYIANLYLGIRLKPCLNKNYMTKTTFNQTCDILYNLWIQENCSLDIMINAVYNYINEYKKAPPLDLLLNDPRAFLEDFGIEETL